MNLKTLESICIAAMLCFPTLCKAEKVTSTHENKKPEWLDFKAEYRVQSLFINPLDLNGTEVTDVHWTEQRLRLELSLKKPKVGRIYIQTDLLAGVLFGDNGSFGSDPEPTSGLAIASKQPNRAGWDVGLRDGADPLNPNSYVPVLHSLSPLAVKYLFGEVYLPFGVLRVGRQALTDGAAISGHDGGRRNRWGVSRFNDITDRILIATKLDEAIRLIRNQGNHKLDTSTKRGVILALTYDWNVQDEITSYDDDTYQTNVVLSWRKDKANWFGTQWRDFQLTGVLVHKGSNAFDTSIWATPLRFETHVGPSFINLQLSWIFGETQEVSEGISLLSAKTPKKQELRQYGAHLYADYKLGPVTLGMEFDYASGDSDPRGHTPLTQFNFTRDFNVGLLLFEHLMAFQSARSAAVGIENLSKLNSPSFPLTEIASDGRFGNAIAIFPQLKVDLLTGPKHWLHARFGVLAAWPAAGVVDPVMTILNEDGEHIEDDAVNFHGGDPGSYYGTEFDLQLEWTVAKFFTWTLEAAYLIPGDALEDMHGDAVPAYLIENRFVFEN
ncbi:MAG TPA: hypothetical protein EYN66_21280 [Myxococcales bacterium]|nr:hypothetical protein [Myxococcales bacterium]